MPPDRGVVRWTWMVGPLTLVAVLGASTATAGGGASVDLQLVQACDASGSVVPREWKLEIDGIAAAFRDPAVVSAIEAGPNGRIAVALMIWADASEPRDTSPWFVIDSEATAEAFASLIEHAPRRVDGGTGIGAAIADAVGYIRRSGLTADRSIIDVSGDGSETPPRLRATHLPEAVAMADADGITINGLAIVNEEPDIETYYRQHVATGPGHFVVTVDDYADFARVYRQKLLREIARQVSLR